MKREVELLGACDEERHRHRGPAPTPEIRMAGQSTPPCILHAQTPKHLNDAECVMEVRLEPAVCVGDGPAAPLLHTAAQRGDVQKIKQLLLDRDVNELDANSWTALHHAAATDASAEVTSLLLAAKASVNSQTDASATPLHMAAFHGRFAMLLQLLLAGADLLAKDVDGHTPLYDALYQMGGRCTCVADTPQRQPGRVVAFLQQAEALTNAAERQALAQRAWELIVSRELDEAMHAGGPAALSRLVSRHRRYIDARDDAGWSALHGAAHSGEAHAVQLLFDGGASLSVLTNLGETPLLLAVREGHALVVRLLLARGADAGAATRGGRTPVAEARRRAATSADGDGLLAILEAALVDCDADRHRTAAAAADRWLPLARAAADDAATRPSFASFAQVPATHPFGGAG